MSFSGDGSAQYVPIPPGWTRHVDPISGGADAAAVCSRVHAQANAHCVFGCAVPYYVNDETGVTTYERPGRKDSDRADDRA